MTKTKTKPKIETLWKLTDAQGYTRPGRNNATLWGPNVTHKVRDMDTFPELCSPAVIHAYRHPIQALVNNAFHAGFDPCRL